MKSKRLFGSAIALSLLSIIGVSCNKEYFQIKNIEAESLNPTFAVPIADMDIELTQLIKRFAADLQNVPSTEYHDPADNVFFLQIRYTDTIDAIPGPTATIPAGTPFPPIEFPLDSSELNIFGELGGGESTFRLLNPSVSFTFVNTMDKAFNMTFDTLYTKDIENNAVYPFRVLAASTPFLIEEGNVAGPAVESLVTLSNDNTESIDGTPNPMSNVLEPTPKFVYNKITLDPIGTDETQAGGEMKVVASVLLPLEGYGKFKYRDTIAIDEIDTTDADLVEEVLIRMIITNSFPIGAELNATVVDTSDNYSEVYKLPFYDENGAEKPNGLFLEAPEVGDASTGFQTKAPKRFFSDIRINKEEYVNLTKGNALIVDFDFYTKNFDANLTESQVVNWYSNYILRVQLGLKVKFNLNGELLSGEE